MGKKFIVNFLVLCLLLFSAGLLLVDAKKPFWGHHDWNSVVYSNIARNYVRYGYITTRFAQVTGYDYVKPQNFSFITHYPPLLPILLSISFRLFGQSEISARLTIILFSVILILFVYRIGEELHSKFMGFFAAISLALTPIFLYFGKLPVHDTIVPAISTVGFWGFLKYKKTENIKYYLFLIALLVFGGLVNWSAYYLVIALVFLVFVTKTAGKIRSKILYLIPVSAAIFLIPVLQLFLIKAKSAGSVFSNVLERADPYLTANQYGFTLPKYLKQELLYTRVYYTLPVFLGAGLFGVYVIYKLFIKKKELLYQEVCVLSLFVYGIMQLVIFSQLSFIHDYMIYYLAPFMVLAYAYVITSIFKPFQKSIVFPVVLVVLTAFIFLSELRYTNTLLATNINERGYMVGKLISMESPSKSLSLVTSGSYKEFQEVFIGYYSQRSVDYVEKLPSNFDTKYYLVIRPKDHDPLPEKEKELLDKYYLRYEDANFIWYKLNLKKT